MQILSRTDAYALGLKKFYTGLPCVHGHVAERYVSTKGCVECLRGAPSEALTRLTFMIDPRDASALTEYAQALVNARALTPDTEEDVQQKRLRLLYANLRRGGCPENQLEGMARSLLGLS